IEAILVEDPGAAATLANHWLVLALCERDPVAAAQAWWRFPTIPSGQKSFRYTAPSVKAWWLAFVGMRLRRALPLPLLAFNRKRRPVRNPITLRRFARSA